MDEGDVEAEPTLLDYAERQTKALERLLLLAQVVLFLAFIGLMWWVIAALGS